MHDVDHVFVDGAARLGRRDDAVIHQRVRHPHRVEALVMLADLLLDQTLRTGHALAADVVVHEDHVAVELLRRLPHLHQVAVAADGVRAHRGAGVPVGHVAHHDVAVLGVDDVVAGERIHVDQAQDAPAVIQPLHAVCVIRRAAAPGNGAVARVREGVDVFAHTFVKDARDLARGLEEVLVAALLVEVDAKQPLAHGVERAVVRLGIDVPALGLLAVELVGVFDVLDERVPVERLVELLFEEVDGVVHLVHAELLAGRVVVHERGRERMHGLLAVA